MVTPPITPSSSAEVIQFPVSGKPEFAKKSKAWLMTTLAEGSIKGHAPRTLFTVLYLHFNYEHFERTGELIAWPSWETMKKFGLSEGGIKEGIKEGEARGFFEVLRGRRKGLRRDVNVYRALNVNRQRQPVEESQPAFPDASGKSVEMMITDSNGERGNHINHINGDCTEPATSAGSDSATRVDSVNRTPERALRPEEGKAVPSSDASSAKSMTAEERRAARRDVASPQLRALLGKGLKRVPVPAAGNRQ